MIKFFRKIRQSLIAQGNLKRYLLYAFGEILLVVIGILIALQINEWNQNRVNATEERRIFQDITDEFQLYQFLCDNGIKTWDTVTASADNLLLIINNPTIRPPDERLDMYIHQLTLNWISGTSATIYDVLGGSGDLALISSASVRNGLVVLKNHMEHLKQFEEFNASFVDQQVRPFLNRSADRTGIRSTLKGNQLNFTRHASPFTSSYDELLKSREFANLLVDLIYYSQRQISAYKRLETQMAQIDSLILTKYPSMVAKPYIPKQN